jgi:Uma2 family endonuclease
MTKTQPAPPVTRAGVYDPHGIIVYPDSDGKPMAENDAQYRAIVNTRFALEQHYLDNQQIYVGADMLMYFEEGDVTKSVAPDVFVALGVPKHTRRTYLLWNEGKPPDVVFEIASPGTWRADLGWKRGLYQGLGVREYILFDPSNAFFRPLLQGYRLHDDIYQPVGILDTARGERGIFSEVLQLELWAQSNDDSEMPFVLRLYSPATSTWLPTPEEAAEAYRAEAQARAAAEARLRELEAELRRLRGKQE